MQHATIVIVSAQTATFMGTDCFMVPDTAFVESNGVQAASLSITVDTPNCPGFAAPLSGVVTATSGKGGPPPTDTGLPLPLTVSLNWSGNGATSISNDRNRMSCGGFSADTRSDMTSAVASASGSLTFA